MKSLKPTFHFKILATRGAEGPHLWLTRKAPSHRPLADPPTYWPTALLLPLLILSGCSGMVIGPPSGTLTASSSSTSTSSSASTSTVSSTFTAAYLSYLSAVQAVPSGARAARIILKQASPTGSFDAPTSGGTVNQAGSGHKAARIFNADGSLLATSPSSSTWPKWLESFEVGISGTNNAAAPNEGCATFATATEASAANCNFGAGAGTANCGAPATVYRVSEVDCLAGNGTTDGKGGPADGVYLRAKFSRDSAYLAPFENLLVVVEYAASSLNPAPSNPTSCFSGGLFSPESCADHTWKAYLKHSLTEVVQPYLLLVPPTFAYVNTTTRTGGAGITTKQFVIPLAADSKLNTLQISRVRANLSNRALLSSTCSNGGTGNSPLCVGIVIYSVTFYRM